MHGSTCRPPDDAEGDLREDLDLEVAVDLLAAPLYYRLLLTGDPVDGPFTDQVVDAVIRFVV